MSDIDIKDTKYWIDNANRVLADLMTESKKVEDPLLQEKLLTRIIRLENYVGYIESNLQYLHSRRPGCPK